MRMGCEWSASPVLVKFGSSALAVIMQSSHYETIKKLLISLDSWLLMWVGFQWIHIIDSFRWNCLFYSFCFYGDTLIWYCMFNIGGKTIIKFMNFEYYIIIVSIWWFKIFFRGTKVSDGNKQHLAKFHNNKHPIPPRSETLCSKQKKTTLYDNYICFGI